MGGGAIVSRMANNCVLLNLFFTLPVPSAEEKTSQKAVLCTQDFQKRTRVSVTCPNACRHPGFPALNIDSSINTPAFIQPNTYYLGFPHMGATACFMFFFKERAASQVQTVKKTL